ncbi:enoyl-CoA hydratase [Pseudoroseomonas rhizosphaerae]|uniref:Enoyl-CoA hydratase n=1 Tax=Teichococcus rhizosphaerae TaxID=1335062 RepID=A0A2C6Z7A0_9PROT|nr:enoyl-CoA hydratase/isomerase family protein [Pseudoroseomonas rhizosphaerae]PHK94381.1 enoyl-CoA hydratase [Pseudoroseomonas rhizosphaerae]
MSAEGVALERDGAVAVLRLCRPDRLNALSAAMRHAIAARLREVAADPGIGVLLLRGEGRAFCAGADLDDMPEDAFAWRERILLAQAQHLALIRMDKIVVAAVQGAAYGGGASLALAADILLLAEDARLGFPFVHLGIVPDGGAAFLLQARLGGAVALDLLLTGGTLPAEEARRLGLTRRVAPVAGFDAAALALAQEVAALPREALALTKSLCRQRWGQGLDNALAHEADAFALATTTASHRAALAAARRRQSAPRKGS